MDTHRTISRLSRNAVDKPPSSLYAECARFAGDEDGHLLRLALLYSDDSVRPLPEHVARDKANRTWDFAMHHKALGERAIAHSYALVGDEARRAFHDRKALVSYPRLFWHSDAELDRLETDRVRATQKRGQESVSVLAARNSSMVRVPPKCTSSEK